MKLRNPPHPLRPRRQKRRPEMQRPLFLPEPTPRHDTNACGIKEAETPEFVGGAVFFFGLGDGSGGEVDCGVEVHGALL